MAEAPSLCSLKDRVSLWLEKKTVRADHVFANFSMTDRHKKYSFEPVCQWMRFQQTLIGRNGRPDIMQNTPVIDDLV